MGDKIADLLPARVRQIIYTVLGTLIALELIWDVLPSGLEGRVLQTFSVLGFGLAASQAPASWRRSA